MKNIRLFCGIFISLLAFTSCSNDENTESNQVNTNTSIIKWEINGIEFQNGTITKTINNSKFEVLENNKDLFIYFLPDSGQINNNTTYNSSNANVDVNIDYNFDSNSNYNQILWETDYVKILEFNSEYISGEFGANNAKLQNSTNGNNEMIDYDITNGTFKIYR